MKKKEKKCCKKKILWEQLWLIIINFLITSFSELVFDIEDLVPVFNKLSDIEKVIRIGKLVIEVGIIAEQVAGI